MILYAKTEDESGIVAETGLSVLNVLTLEPGSDDYSTTKVTMANGLVIQVHENFYTFAERLSNSTAK